MDSYYYLIIVGIAGGVASNRLFRKQDAVKNEGVTVANVTKALTPVGVVFWWLSLAVLIAGVALSFFSSGGGSSAHKLYDAFKSVNPDSSDVRMKYLDGKVLKECDLGADQTLEFGWAKIRQVVSSGDMTSAPSDYKIYILTEHFHGTLTTVKFLGRDEVQPMLDYGAMKGCALQLDSE